MDAVYNVNGCTRCTCTLIISVFRDQLPAFWNHVMTKPQINNAQSSMKKVSRKWIMSIFGLLFDLHPLQVTRLIAKSIAWINISFSRQKRKIKPNKTVCTPRKTLLGTTALCCLNTTHLFQIFWSTDSTKLFDSFFLFPWNRFFQFGKLPTLATAKQPIVAHTVWQIKLDATRRPCVSIYSRLRRKISRRKSTLLWRERSYILIWFVAIFKVERDTNHIHEETAI